VGVKSVDRYGNACGTCREWRRRRGRRGRRVRRNAATDASIQLNVHIRTYKPVRSITYSTISVLPRYCRSRCPRAPLCLSVCLSHVAIESKLIIVGLFGLQPTDCSFLRLTFRRQATSLARAANETVMGRKWRENADFRPINHISAASKGVANVFSCEKLRPPPVKNHPPVNFMLAAAAADSA